MGPLLESNQRDETELGANSTYTVGLIAMATIAGKERQIFLGDNSRFRFIGNERWTAVKDQLWWQSATTIRYRKPSAQELAAAVKRKLIEQKHLELLS